MGGEIVSRECGLVGGKYLESVHEGRAFARRNTDFRGYLTDYNGYPAGQATGIRRPLQMRCVMECG